MLRNSKFQYTPPQETRFFLLLIVLVLSTSGTRTRSMHFEYEYEYHFIEYDYDGKPNCATSKGASRVTVCLVGRMVAASACGSSIASAMVLCTA